uniref:E3 ubiquitin-protein ligase n=1 Tax=Anopheles dirus TaxID=7168 RepID=A0A182N0G2_9DIPT
MYMNQLREQWESRFRSDGLDPEHIVEYFRNIAGSFVMVQPTAPGTDASGAGGGNQQQQQQPQQPAQSPPPPSLNADAHGNSSFVPGNYVFNEAGARAATISLMEEFICGPNPEEYLQQLKQTDTKSSVCGRVFKIGEPTYSCRECSMDPTCVLCSNCFKKSTHRTHKYKMATSGGGGCCDCGDLEAWKKDPFCEEHACISDDAQARQQEQAELPADAEQRCTIVFRAVLDYCMQTLHMYGGTDNHPDLEFDENTHCTILYNDETHTFDQVIQTLTSIVKCPHKMAIEYVTSIDREGRAVVKCASFAVCKKLKEDIELRGFSRSSSVANRTQPLKVAVMHRNELACQHMAMLILGWYQEFLTKHSAFRRVFADTITRAQTMFNLKFILSNDHKLWKSARTAWHRLLISGLLMEYGNKKLLATTFTRQYASLMQDFIRDDHYHSFSIVSMSVQLFTVPTIAHTLIERESAFFKLMHTYFTETIEKYVKNRQLVFAKNTATSNAFKRAGYILIDLKYLLSFKPEVWTQDLRTGFLHGVQQLLKLLRYMQGMDAVTRQVGQHLEYEQEWETAFTLHLKLSHLITLVLEWCATDKAVLVKVYRMVLRALTEVRFIVHESSSVACEVADHSATCLAYDVLSKPVSVHLPLTRFLAGLYVEIERYELTFDSIAPNAAERPTPEQIIEPVLCARTMMSQVHANMWRRNGYALINQLFFYRNVKCRYEMLDRDIVILQMGASLIEANEFCIHVLRKYKLLGWLESDQPESAPRPVEATTSSLEDDQGRQVSTLVEEFLELMIVIIGERYVPGVGDVSENDRIRKEIVQQLCIKPHSHSELSRALNEDNCSEFTVESVIDDVAVFEKPNAAEKKGVYKLKPEYYAWFNLYFYHYSKEDKSKSEEMQRNRQKERNELMCCPPPQLPKLTQAFSIIPNLLQCDVMLKVMGVVLSRAIDLKSVSFSEGQLQRVLHLIGYAIQEEETGYYPYLKFYDRCQDINMLAQLEELSRSPRVESQRDLLRWVINRYRAVEAKRNAQNQSDIDRAESSGSGLSSADAERQEKEQRAKMAAVRRAQLMAQMQNAQRKFMTSHAEMFEAAGEGEEDMAGQEAGATAATSTAASTSAGAAASAGHTDEAMEWQATGGTADGGGGAAASSSRLVCLGPNRQIPRPADGSALRHTCILCSEESVLGTFNTSGMVYAAFVQRSSVLSRYQQTDERGLLQLIETKTHPSPQLTTCGHVMHIACFDKYFSNEMVKEHRRPYRNRTPILFDIDKQEFLCPLCRFLGNCLLPLIPPHATITSGARARLSAALQRIGFSDIPEPPITQPGAFKFPLWYALMSDLVAKKAGEDDPQREQPEQDPQQQQQQAQQRPSDPAPAKQRRVDADQRMNVDADGQDPPPLPMDGGEDGGNQSEDEALRPVIDLDELLRRYPLQLPLLPQDAQVAAPTEPTPQQPEPEQPQHQQPAEMVEAAAPIDVIELLDDEEEEEEEEVRNVIDLDTDEGQSTEEDNGNSDDDDLKAHEQAQHLPITAITKELERAHQVRLRYYGTLRDIPVVGRLFDGVIKGALVKFCQAVGSFTNVPAKAQPFADYLSSWLACSYTIKSLEMVMRVLYRPLGSELSIRYEACLSGLVRVACSMGAIVPTQLMQTGAFDYMVDVYETLFGYKPSSPFFLEWDLFGLLCTCLFTTRGVLYSWVRSERIPKGDALDHSIVQAIFLVNMLRTIITSAVTVDEVLDEREGEDAEMLELTDADEQLTYEQRNLLRLYRQYNIHQAAPKARGDDEAGTAGTATTTGPTTTTTTTTTAAQQRRLCRQLVADVRAQSHTLLRCCCLLFHSITDVPLPACCDVPDHDYDLMVAYLDLPPDPLDNLYPGSPMLALIERLAACNADQIERMRWARQEQLLGGPAALFQTAPPVRQLIELPDDYSDLINSVSLFTCPNNIRDDSRNPTMCLVCGEILCSQSFCCQRELDKSSVGSCTYHTEECGAGIGIFLRIRDAEILLLGINKGCFMPAPYLDEYGETDQGLRRGNPLRLCKGRYRKLHYLWLSHALHEEITRRNESQQTLFATQWQNL